MELLEISLPTAAENVALDEALLDAAEAGVQGAELLRLWEFPRPAVVLGRSSKAAEEADLEACQCRGIEVVRRASGGAAIVAGPGCLMYSLLLSYHLRPQLRMLDQAHHFVLNRLARALTAELPALGDGAVEHLGISDLAIGQRKISGNSLRCKRDWLLYHGTLLYQMQLPLIGQLLKAAPRQPDYRQGRSHEAFLANAPFTRRQLTQAVTGAFAARQATRSWPGEAVAELVHERYGQPSWTLQR